MVLPVDPKSVVLCAETTLPVGAAGVWALVRDFDAMPAWNASVRDSRIEDGPADRVGCRRVLTFDDGGVWTHQLTGLSDADMRLQYRIVATPQPMRIPVWNYRAEIQVISGPGPQPPAAHEACCVRWSASFDTGHAEAMETRARAVFAQGFEGLRRHFGAGG